MTPRGVPTDGHQIGQGPSANCQGGRGPPDAHAGIATKIGCHSFRATGITNYLEHDGTLEKAQQMAAHASPRKTKLYDRTNDQVTLDEVEKIRL
ncbi:hypothetical protein SAMN05444166_2322 [Singulisphaera sp. GP187]|nr:hypothetical protein [Singulisphaera sp. GP187]SIO07555.1 hypothetical protein SAMN05444166_2322 [Singulisphaera sp. GP187]